MPSTTPSSRIYRRVDQVNAGKSWFYFIKKIVSEKFWQILFRYGLFDFEYMHQCQGTSESSKKQKLFLMSWCPDTAKVRICLNLSRFYWRVTIVQSVRQLSSTCETWVRYSPTTPNSTLSIIFHPNSHALQILN